MGDIMESAVLRGNQTANNHVIRPRTAAVKDNTMDSDKPTTSIAGTSWRQAYLCRNTRADKWNYRDLAGHSTVLYQFPVLGHRQISCFSG